MQNREYEFEYTVLKTEHHANIEIDLDEYGQVIGEEAFKLNTLPSHVVKPILSKARTDYIRGKVMEVVKNNTGHNNEFYINESAIEKLTQEVERDFKEYTEEIAQDSTDDEE